MGFPHGGTDIDDIVSLLTLDRAGPDRFCNRHHSVNISGSLFGGQILAQAVAAADLTVVDRSIHSLHAYFLRAGNDTSPVEFRVERIRDGRRFSVRRVAAIQDVRIIFTMDCSYRVSLEGFCHQRQYESPFAPESAIDPVALLGSRPDLAPYAALFSRRYPIEIRIPSEDGFFRLAKEPKRHYWLRVPSAARVENANLQRQIFAYISDFMLSGVPLTTHTVALPGKHVVTASLDHCIWFHRPMRCDDWLLFETESPSAGNSVNLSRAHAYDRSGSLVATIAQESLQHAL